MSITPVPRQRLHTLHFLEEIQSIRPVFLDTEVDMRHVLEHRQRARQASTRISIVTYVLHASARVLARHPSANAATSGRIRPRTVSFATVSGKLTLDKTLDGHRIAAAAILRSLESRDLLDIQREVEYYRNGDPALLPEYAAMRLLHRLPWPVRTLAYRRATRSMRRRSSVFGTFAVTSLGHRAVDGFHSVGGTAITIGIGRVLERPVARQGELAVAPIMRLSLSFDHRVIDGAEAADVLTEIKDALEAPQPARSLGPAATGSGGTR